MTLYLEADSIGRGLGAGSAGLLLLFFAGLALWPSFAFFFNGKQLLKRGQILLGILGLFLGLASFFAFKEFVPWLINKEPILQVQGRSLYLMETPGQIQIYPLESIEEVNWYEEEMVSSVDVETTYYEFYIEFKLKGKDQPIRIPVDYFKLDSLEVKVELETYFSNFPSIEMHKVTQDIAKAPVYSSYF